MTKKEKVSFLMRELAALYPETPIPLDHQDPFTLLVAVMLSAQCTDERVNQVTPALFGRAATPRAMAGLTIAEIETIIRPCGLAPAKAKNIHRMSELILERHGGEVPEDLEALEALPGVGHKTAQVVVAQAFGIPAFPVDTHIHRLAQRWGLTKGKNVLQTEKDLKRLFPEAAWNQLHLRIIFYGREHCQARRLCDGALHGCGFCPVLNPGRQRPKQVKKA